MRSQAMVPESAAPSDVANKGWFVVLGGYAAMYLPTYWWAANGIWQTDEHGHGALILAVLVWLFWTLRTELNEVPAQPLPALGWPVLLLGLLLYVAGRAFSISIAEFSSQLLVVAGILLLVKGPSALRVAWFPIIYIVFMIPMPSVLVDAITGSLKQSISSIVVEVLHAAGYPVAQSGVTISIGQYQMLVADACSGLHSMFSLMALGTLFMYITDRKSKLHNLVMFALILPVAYAANCIRVIILVLVTYYFGDDAGQGFVHGVAGVALMLVALAMLFLIDASISRLNRSR